MHMHLLSSFNSVHIGSYWATKYIFIFIYVFKLTPMKSVAMLSKSSYFLVSLLKLNVGFIISGKKILTNAHVVADHTFVLVRKHGSPTKYRAEVQAVGHECDLAILVVNNEEFWEDTNCLELGDIPILQETVAVVGYPQGIDFYHCLNKLNVVKW